MREELIGELFRQVREEQEDVQAFDEAAASKLGINLTDLRVLGILDRLGSVSATELAEEAGLTTGSITALVDRLEAAGYARRARDEADRRRVFVELTDRARERMERIWGPIAEDAYRIADSYSNDELRLIIEYLERGRELLRRHHTRIQAEGRE